MFASNLNKIVIEVTTVSVNEYMYIVVIYGMFLIVLYNLILWKLCWTIRGNLISFKMPNFIENIFLKT